MTSEALFGKSPDEAVLSLRAFVNAERGQRVAMLNRHRDSEEYWRRRIDAADLALADLDVIEAALDDKGRRL